MSFASLSHFTQYKFLKVRRKNHAKIDQQDTKIKVKIFVRGKLINKTFCEEKNLEHSLAILTISYSYTLLYSKTEVVNPLEFS